jgi:Fe-S cluster biogenesis protein NfuA
MLTVQQVETVLGRFNNLLSRDGGKLTLKELAADQLVVDYTIGKNDCPDCVLHADDLGAMISEALPGHGSNPPVKILTS